MLKNYHAIYEKGKLKWINGKPDIKDGTKVTVLIEHQAHPRPKRTKEEIRNILDEAWGAWGTGKSLEEIDREIETMREAAWSRDWERYE